MADAVAAVGQSPTAVGDDGAVRKAPRVYAARWWIVVVYSIQAAMQVRSAVERASRGDTRASVAQSLCACACCRGSSGTSLASSRQR